MYNAHRFLLLCCAETHNCLFKSFVICASWINASMGLQCLHCTHLGLLSKYTQNVHTSIQTCKSTPCDIWRHRLKWTLPEGLFVVVLCFLNRTQSQAVWKDIEIKRKASEKINLPEKMKRKWAIMMDKGKSLSLKKKKNPKYSGKEWELPLAAKLIAKDKEGEEHAFTSSLNTDSHCRATGKVNTVQQSW